MNRTTSWGLRGAGLAALAAGLAVSSFAACNQGRQGDRCNPNLVSTNPAPQYNEDECGSGLSCQVPPTCAVAFCCPSKPPYADPNCACFYGTAEAGCACAVPALIDSGASDAGNLDSGGDA